MEESSRSVMQVLINSDILFATYLMRKLPAGLRELAAACGRHQIAIVLPETALFEFQHKQDLQAEAERRAIRNAFKVLDRHAVDHGEVDLETAVTRPDLVALLEAAGATVRVEEPTLVDFEEAHRRACYHEPPGSPDAKSDEMRDLVIWAQATRLSREGGGLLLLSRDSVHVGRLGDSEAAEVGVTRVRSVEEALGFLELDPAGRLAQEFLASAAPSLRAAGLPLADPVKVSFVRDPSFVQADFGVSEARFVVKVAATEGRSLHAKMSMFRDPSVTRFSVSNAEVDGEAVDDTQVEFDTPVATRADPTGYDQRLGALQRVLGGSHEPTDG